MRLSHGLRIPHEPARVNVEGIAAFIATYLDLLMAARLAREGHRDIRTNPVPRHQLWDGEPGGQVLLWMFYQGHVELCEPASGTTNGLKMSDEGSEGFLRGERAIVLTQVGEDFADLFLANVLFPETEADFATAWDMLQVGRLVPIYDSATRQFRWGGHILKHFRQPAGNQELILCTAEELNWPKWFDDPLLPAREIRQKTRLHDTIKDLNRRQIPLLVHFKGDGSGTRVGWELR